MEGVAKKWRRGRGRERERYEWHIAGGEEEDVVTMGAGGYTLPPGGLKYLCSCAGKKRATCS
jgi:hypothetical protein